MRTLPTCRSTTPPARNICRDRGRLRPFPTRLLHDRIRCQQSCDRVRAVSGSGTRRVLVPNEDAHWCSFAVVRLRPVRLCLEQKSTRRSQRQSKTRRAYGLSRTRQPTINDESLTDPLCEKPRASARLPAAQPNQGCCTRSYGRASAESVRGFR